MQRITRRRTLVPFEPWASPRCISGRMLWFASDLKERGTLIEHKFARDKCGEIEHIRVPFQPPSEAPSWHRPDRRERRSDALLLGGVSRLFRDPLKAVARFATINALGRLTLIWFRNGAEIERHRSLAAGHSYLGGLLVSDIALTPLADRRIDSTLHSSSPAGFVVPPGAFVPASVRSGAPCGPSQPSPSESAPPFRS
jgi:hypothetical protein